MEELDFLKQHWQKDEDFPKVDQNAIRTMLHKSSSSIVKWIFYISVLELFVGFCLNFFIPSGKDPENVSVFLDWVDVISSVVFYIFIAYFIYKFFSSYNKIKNTNNTRLLLATILETRKTVERYIKFNLVYIGFVSIVVTITLIISKSTQQNSWGVTLFYVLGIGIIMLLVIGFLLWIMRTYYRIVYRRLVKKLNVNYEELVKLDKEKPISDEQ